MKKFEVGKAYHLVSVKSGDILNVVFINARISFEYKNYAVIGFLKKGKKYIKVVQIDTEGLTNTDSCIEVFYLGKHRNKLCRSFFEVKELQGDFSMEDKDE